MTLTDALLRYLSTDGREAKMEAAIRAAGAASEAGLPVWFWYDGEGEPPLQVVIDLPLGCVCLPLPVLHSKPEGVLSDWPEQVAAITRTLVSRGLS